MRQSNTVILCTRNGVCRPYTSWEALARATGWNANSIRVLWSRVKNKDTGMAYNGHTVYRCADNIQMSDL